MGVHPQWIKGINTHKLPRAPKVPGGKQLTAPATVCTSICMSGGYLVGPQNCF